MKLITFTLLFIFCTRYFLFFFKENFNESLKDINLKTILKTFMKKIINYFNNFYITKKINKNL